MNEVAQPATNPPEDVDSWKIKLSKGQADHSYSVLPTQIQPVDAIFDEIDLEPDTLLQGRTPAKCKGKDPLAPRPSIIKRKNKKVQLNRIQSLADLSGAGLGYDYGLSEKDY